MWLVQLASSTVWLVESSRVTQVDMISWTLSDPSKEDMLLLLLAVALVTAVATAAAAAVATEGYRVSSDSSCCSVVVDRVVVLAAVVEFISSPPRGQLSPHLETQMEKNPIGIEI